MNRNYVTIGEFAELARTTKRTIQWYDKKGILEPKTTDSETGYRLYTPEQVIDFQLILLLTKLDFTLEEIKKFITQKKSFRNVFLDKYEEINAQIEKLQTTKKLLKSYYDNTSSTGSLVKPQLIEVPEYSIYYIEKKRFVR